MVVARTAGIVVLCLLLVALNLYTLWRVVRLEQMIDRPISVSCSGSTVSADALRGIVIGGMSFAPELLADGRVQAVLEFTLYEKEPGSTISVLHRDSADAPWMETSATAAGPLAFEARFAAGVEDRLRCQVVEKVRGEIVRASQERFFTVSEWVGDPGVRFAYTKYQGASTIEFRFCQRRGVSGIAAWQVEEIVLHVTRKGKTEEIRLTEPDWDTFRCQIQDADLESVEVVVRYRDGVERRAEIKPPYTNVPEPLVTR